MEVHGGSGGVRDEGLLLSALAMPQAAFFGEYAHKDIYEMAAAYLFHIVMNHPFVDGNKRTGSAAAIIFLGMNDIKLTADNPTLVEFTLAVAQSEKNKPEITAFLKHHSRPLSQ
ncbi:MAG: type II toxin-antitoxin system death-on-curing family toxin [Planctomycetota bacterium]|nr:MAG: type II toxin-antitoxin system death-on-curing family toxin [Planctomycetota bacterium]